MRKHISDAHLAGETESVEWLKATPKVAGQDRPLNIPSRQVRSHTPPSCPRLSEFNAIHSNKGDRNG
jgi:hypothetical protein